MHPALLDFAPSLLSFFLHLFFVLNLLQLSLARCIDVSNSFLHFTDDIMMSLIQVAASLLELVLCPLAHRRGPLAGRTVLFDDVLFPYLPVDLTSAHQLLVVQLQLAGAATRGGVP